MSVLPPTGTVLMVASITAGTLSNADGYKLFIALKEALVEQPGSVTLDLTDVVNFSSSFLNSSLGALYDEFGIVGYKRLRLNNYKPAQAKMLKDYMADVAQTHQA
ncbi:MAG: STAS-like domain-containing protein [Janthinobacterium lividum]